MASVNSSPSFPYVKSHLTSCLPIDEKTTVQAANNLHDQAWKNKQEDNLMLIEFLRLNEELFPVLKDNDQQIEVVTTNDVSDNDNDKLWVFDRW